MRSNQSPQGTDTHRRPVTRRAVLGGVGSAIVLGTGRRAAAQTGDGDQGGGEEDDADFAVVQGGRCVPVTPISGDEPVEAMYGLRVPERFGGENGSTDPGSGPYHESTGTTDLQRPNTSVTFLYDGPDGLSLVVVHGHGERGNGGSATWRVEGLPSDGGWIVRDDYYLDPQSGDIAPSCYDRWNLTGAIHTVDWTWDDARTDGGAFRPLGGEFEVTVTPAYNEAATLWEEHYSGRVSDWQLLSGSRESPERHSLALNQPATVRSGGCGDDGQGG